MRLVLSIMITFNVLFADFSRDDLTQIVLDNATKLQWQDDAPGAEKHFYEAITKCEELELGSFDDWRLPNINELNSIVDRDRTDPAIDPVFKNIVEGGGLYWSSTPSSHDSNGVESHALAWRVYFYEGTSLKSRKGKRYNVRCVRGGL